MRTTLRAFAVVLLASMATSAQLLAELRAGTGDYQIAAQVEAISLATGAAETFYFTQGFIPDHPNPDEVVTGLEFSQWPASTTEGAPGTETELSPSSQLTGRDYGQLSVIESGFGQTGSLWNHPVPWRPQINVAVAAGSYTLDLDGAMGGTTINAGDRFRVDDSDELYVVLATATASGGGAITGLTFWPAAPTGGFDDNAKLQLGSWRAGSQHYAGHCTAARWDAYAFQSATVSWVGTLASGERVTWANRGTLVGAALVGQGVSSNCQPGGGLVLPLDPPGIDLIRPVARSFKGFRRAMLLQGGGTQKGEMTDAGADWQPTDFTIMMRFYLGVEYRDASADTYLLDKTDYRLYLRSFANNTLRAEIVTGSGTYTADSPALGDLERWYWFWVRYDDTANELEAGWMYDDGRALADLQAGTATSTAGTLNATSANITLGATVAGASEATGILGEIMAFAAELTDPLLLQYTVGPLQNAQTVDDLIFYIGDYNLGMTEAFDLGPSYDPQDSPTSVYNATLTSVGQGHSLEGGTVLRGSSKDFVLGRADNHVLSAAASSDAIASDFAMYSGSGISVLEALWVDGAGGLATYTGDGVSDLDFSTGPNLITRVGGSFIDDGFLADRSLTVTGSASNNGTLRVTAVTALTLAIDETLVGELDVAATLTQIGPVAIDTAATDSRAGVYTSLVDFFANAPATDKYTLHTHSGTVRLGSLTSGKGIVTFDGWGKNAVATRGVEFDGVDDTGNAGTGLASMWTSDYTVSGSLQMLDDSDDQVILFQDGGDTHFQLAWINDAGLPDKLSASVGYWDGSTYQISSLRADAPDKTPLDFAVTVDYVSGSPNTIDVKIYINGALDASSTISPGEANAAAVGDLDVGNAGGISHAHVRLCRLAFWDAVLTQTQIADYHVTELDGTETNLVSCYEGTGRKDPLLWEDLNTSSGNDITLSGSAWLSGCTVPCIQRGVYELATTYGGATDAQVDMTDSWLIPTDAVSVGLPGSEASALNAIDFMRWGASSSFIFDTEAGTWKLVQITDPQATTPAITIIEEEILGYSAAGTSDPVHSVAVGYQPVGLTQTAEEMPAATPGRIALVEVPLRYTTPVLINGNAENHPQAGRIARVYGAWYKEGPAATEATRLAGIIGVVERDATVQIACPIPLLAPQDAVTVCGAMVEGGVKKFTVIASRGDANSRTYSLKG